MTFPLFSRWLFLNSIPKERKLAGNLPGTKYPAFMLHEYITYKAVPMGRYTDLLREPRLAHRR
ncbi:hypothetical protein I7I48_06506 [Histoplasma ohiense]|nr:hypothetical protein I7I48_06506 [Histoplasma ohiense (nom. inval.)]